MKSSRLFIVYIIIFCTLSFSTFSFAEVKVYLAPYYGEPNKLVALSIESLSDKNFPKPIHNQPVLFVHGHESGSGYKSFKEHWQHLPKGLPSFQQTLSLPQNAHLDIEPYYIDLEDYHSYEEKLDRSLEEDARKIKEAVALILLHQGDPRGSTKKVAIIAYGRGAISARLFLKNLWEEQNRTFAFLPVSELITISAPNHGLNDIKDWGTDCLALRQLANGFHKNCTPFNDSHSQGFMEHLNGHPIQDSRQTNYCASIFDSEAPGCRRNNEPVEKGILYVNLYAANNTSITGGDSPSDDCQGRVLAKNLAPLAENREVAGISGSNPLEVHRFTVHNSEIICFALYSAAYHQAPPFGLEFEKSKAHNPLSPPIVPSIQPACQDKSVVLLMDISQSMTASLPRIQETIPPYIKLLGHHWDGIANLGIAVFPALPWSCQPQKEGCTQTIDAMTTLTGSGTDETVDIIGCLSAQGYTPLLKGLDTALEMLGTERQKTIILISDGHHNYPSTVKSSDLNPEKRFSQSEDKQVALYSIGVGVPLGVNYPLLNKPGQNNPSRLKGKFYQVLVPSVDNTPDNFRSGKFYETELTKAFHQTFQSIFSQLLDLSEGESISGEIMAGDSVKPGLKIDPHARKISFLLTWDSPGKKRLNLSIDADEDSPHLASPSLKMSEGKTFQLVTLYKDELKVRDRGDELPWQLRIEAPGLDAGDTENYRLSILMDSPVRMDAGFDKSLYYSGDTITLHAAIMRNGNPLTGLNEVTVSVSPPAEGVGNWFARHKITPFELESLPDSNGDERLSRLERKTVFLVEKEGTAFPGYKKGAPLPRIPLFDDGSHGDKRKGDGVYTNRFKDTGKEGTYTFNFQAAGADFSLEQNCQQYISIKPNPQYSLLELKWFDKSSDESPQYLYNINLIPKDSLGNFLGPGHSVTAGIVYKDGIEQLSPFQLEDQLDGAYKGIVAVPPSLLKQDAKIDILIDGHPFIKVEKIPARKKRSMGFYCGFGVPGFAYSKIRSGNINLGGQIETRFSPQFSLLGMIGYNRLGRKSSANEGTLAYWNISANLKSEIGRSRFRLFINVGPGLYIPDGGVIQPGFNFGLGTSYSLTSKWLMELGINVHYIFTGEVPEPNFYVPYARFLYRF